MQLSMIQRGRKHSVEHCGCNASMGLGTCTMLNGANGGTEGENKLLHLLLAPPHMCKFRSDCLNSCFPLSFFHNKLWNKIFKVYVYVNLQIYILCTLRTLSIYTNTHTMHWCLTDQCCILAAQKLYEVCL